MVMKITSGNIKMIQGGGINGSNGNNTPDGASDRLYGNPEPYGTIFFLADCRDAYGMQYIIRA